MCQHFSSIPFQNKSTKIIHGITLKSISFKKQFSRKSMMGVESGRGVQIIKTSDNSYHLNEEELKEILLHEDIVDLRVVVVSVAGAYRGGKSFLLGFFLKYLYSDEKTRENNKWLGGENDPLMGFDWRGGSERNTTGVLMWSQPFRLNLPNGETVAVILLDTQGTFDSTSTVRDCSTIFGLSTLVSSLQIYNLSQNIKEDDFQHLQLFTEYGRLVLDKGLKPFQRLKFLVRDWYHIHEHAFGADGGNQLLEKRLKISTEQADELKEIRKHILSCFEAVDCFLMPHPGFNVFDPEFKGCLKDIGNDFKGALLKLIPSIFRPENLVPKMIGGRRIKCRDLYDCIKSYMKIFNSDELPTPLSIMKATAEASMMIAKNEAHSVYIRMMDAKCGKDTLCVSSEALLTYHETAKEAAIVFLDNKKFMGDDEITRSIRKDVLMNIETSLTQYKLINDAKINNAMEDAKLAYDDGLEFNDNICVHITTLKEYHIKAVEYAIRVFKEKWQEEPKDISEMLEVLEERKYQHQVLNDQNNRVAISKALEKYKNLIQEYRNDDIFYEEELLEIKHNEYSKTAIKSFQQTRTKDIAYLEDDYLAELLKDINIYFKETKEINAKNKETAIQTALTAYNDIMSKICGAKMPYLHQKDLEIEHKSASEKSLQKLKYSNEEVVKALNEQYSVLFDKNDYYNNEAVRNYYAVYNSTKELPEGTKAILSNIIALPALPFIPLIVRDRHRYAKNLAEEQFLAGRRKQMGDEHTDVYYNKLVQMINDAYARS